MHRRVHLFACDKVAEWNRERSQARQLLCLLISAPIVARRKQGIHAIKSDRELIGRELHSVWCREIGRAHYACAAGSMLHGVRVDRNLPELISVRVDVTYS